LPIWMDLIREVYKDKPLEPFDTIPKAITASPEAIPSPDLQAKRQAQ